MMMEPCEDLQRRVEAARRDLEEHRVASRPMADRPDEDYRRRHEELKQAVQAAEQDLADCLSSPM